jgi:carbohydrate diacid regulator
MITYKLAQQIVEQTMLRLHHNINVISLDGTIIASGDVTRLENIHTATEEVLKTKQPVYIFEHMVNRYPNAKPGINLPIFFQDEIVCIVGVTGSPEEIEGIAKLVQLTAEVIINQALLESRSEWQRKMSVHIFFELIEGAEIKGILKERIQKLPFELKPPFAVSLIRAKHKKSSHRTLIQYLEDYFYDQPILYGHYELDEYYILSTSTNNQALTNMIYALYTYLSKQFSIKIGVGKNVDNVSLIKKSYDTAKQAVNIQVPNRDITFYDDISLQTMFNQDDIQAYSNTLLAPLNSKLKETLNYLFQNNLQLNATAEKLEIHRHTLTYRLEKIHALTGLNPLQFKEALKLQVALWFEPKRV